MAIDYCVHIPTSHAAPATLVQYYDAMEGREDSASITAALGEDLCGELGKRAEALYQFAARKEG